MARLQILHLPDVHVGDTVEQPFALVLDQADQHSEFTENFSLFAGACGARAALITQDTIDIVT